MSFVFIFLIAYFSISGAAFVLQMGARFIFSTDSDQSEKMEIWKIVKYSLLWPSIVIMIIRNK